MRAPTPSSVVLGIGLVLLTLPACANRQRRAGDEPVPLDTTSLVVLGGTDADPLFGVVGAAIVGDHIVVADGGSHTLRFYTMDGELDAVVGGEGGGPGEFRRMMWLQEVGGYVFVFDPNLTRVSEFSGAGDLIGSVNVVPVGAYGCAWPVGMFPDHSILVLASTRCVGGMGQATAYRDTIPLLRYDPKGELLDSLGAYVQTEIYAGTFGDLHIMWELPLGRTSALVVRGWRYYVIQNDEALVVVHDTTGATVRALHDEIRQPPSITPDDVAAVRERLLPPEMPNRNQLREIVEQIPIPSTPPPYGWFGKRWLTMLRVSHDGDVWALEFGGLPGSLPVWTVFGSDGSRRGRVSANEELDILDANDSLVLVHRWNDLDVETVELRRIRW